MIFCKCQVILRPCSRISSVVNSFSTKARNLRTVQMAFNEYNFSNEKSQTPVVIMHGLFGSKANWQSLSKAISKTAQRSVFTLDARNHGNSPHSDEFSYDYLAADIKAFLEAQGLEKVCLVGHSMGGRAAMTFALQFEQFIEKLVVVDISPVSNSSDLTRMQKYFDALRSVNLDDSWSTSEGRKKADDQLKSTISDPSIRSFLLTNLVKSDSGRFLWRMNLDVLEKNFASGIAKFELPPIECRKPVLFIGGLKSDYLQQKDEPVIRKIFPDSHFVYLNTGHWVHAENPTEFINVLVDFLKTKS